MTSNVSLEDLDKDFRMAMEHTKRRIYFQKARRKSSLLGALMDNGN